jgi:CRP/FNR family cyclic AMP-dependent transcriptional regulator
MIQANPDERLMEQALRMTRGFAPWPPQAMAQLVSSSCVGRYVRGDVVMTEPSTHAFTIVSGNVVAGYRSADGAHRTVALLGPGRIVGLARALSGKYNTAFNFAANNDATVVHVPIALLFEILDREPQLWNSMARMLLRQHRDGFDAIAGHVMGPIRQRLATTIERSVELFGYRSHGKTDLRLRLKQEDLAAILHVSRQTVNQELNSLSASGVVRLERQTVVVLDLAELREISRPCEKQKALLTTPR